MASKIDVNSNINLFIDKTKFFGQSNTTLQNFLDKVYNWLKKRKLNLDYSKMSSCKCSKKLSFSIFDFKVNNTNLFSNKVLKDLGIIIAENLKLNHNIKPLPIRIK